MSRGSEETLKPETETQNAVQTGVGVCLWLLQGSHLFVRLQGKLMLS